MVSRNSFFSGLMLLAITGLGAVLPLASGQPARFWPPDQFLPLTDARIAALPAPEQSAWREYLGASRKLAAALPAPTVPDFSPNQPIAAKLPSAKHVQGLTVNAAAKFYATEEARVLAGHVVAWQTAAGGWTKGNDYALSRPPAKPAATDVWSGGTFDNNATILEMRFLVRVIAANPDDARSPAWRGSFQLGLGYIFAAQYPNGGFPQIYPLAGGYHDAITYNDDAMVRVLELLRDVAAGQTEFAFVPAEQRAEAAGRLVRGIDCILKSQITESSGRRTVWCQQHDMLTLKPCAARNFEPIAATSAESSYLLLFLMSLPAPMPVQVAAVNDAVAWLEKVQMRDVVWERHALPTRLVDRPGAPALWSRLYEIETDKPVFGDRDHSIHYAVGEISAERQKGYAWFGDRPLGVLAMHEAWLKKIKH